MKVFEAFRMDDFLGNYIIMPPWSLEELLTAGSALQLGFTKEDITNRYNIAGGSARLVLNTHAAYRDLDEVIKAARCSGKKLIALVENQEQQKLTSYAAANDPTGTGPQPRISYFVHLVIPTEGDSAYKETKIQFTFASAFTEQLAVESLVKETASSLQTLAVQWITGGVSGSFAGNILERLGNETIRKGGLFHMVDLHTKDVFAIRFPPLEFTSFEDVTFIGKQNPIYYVAHKSNQAAVDAVLPPQTAFQITVTKTTHQINYTGIVRLMQQLVRRYFF